MKISVLGGGPAGLYFSILMKCLDSGHQIEVFERNPKDNTFGWGVVFSARTIGHLESSEPETYRRIAREMRSWKDVDITHRGVLTSVGGNDFSGIARIKLLNILQQRCEELEVKVHYEHEINGPDDYPEADLVVAADGVNSNFRSLNESLFEPSLRVGDNRYVWYGTEQSFNGLGLIFRPRGDELYMAHCYRYSRDLSTFIVEVDLPTWEKIQHLSDDESKALLEEVFADDLGGKPLLSNHSKWIQFVEVKNQNWWAPSGQGGPGAKVLLGDALHTAHFSIGSGTKLALEDAVALARAFAAYPDTEQALQDFVEFRRPPVEKLQTAAAASQQWFEEARKLMHLEVLPFCYECMTRSSRLDDDSLRRRDPGFVAAVERWQKAHS